MKKRIASIDYGTKRLGVAISDPNQLIASPLGVVQASKSPQATIEALVKLLKPYELERILLGYPTYLDGRPSALTEEVNRFCALLKEHTSYEITLFDERLSSVQAERSLREGGMRRKERSKVIDAVTAVILLQCYLGY